MCGKSLHFIDTKCLHWNKKKTVSKPYSLSIIATMEGRRSVSSCRISVKHITLYEQSKWLPANLLHRHVAHAELGTVRQHIDRSQQSCLIKVDGYSRCERDYSCTHFGPLMATNTSGALPSRTPFFVLQIGQTASGAHPASYSSGIAVLSRRQSDRGVKKLTTSAEVQEKVDL